MAKPEALSAKNVALKIGAAVAGHARIRHHARELVNKFHPEAAATLPDNGRRAGAAEPK